jgi:hypothetical protein
MPTFNDHHLTAQGHLSRQGRNNTLALKECARKVLCGEVRREHDLPAYLVPHHATLAEMAPRSPSRSRRAIAHRRRLREKLEADIA